jgi:predicted polyphosphate/ATP-dependent NAD kinase
VKRLGLIVNPIAGIGGRVGLKGSDGKETQRKALELGAKPIANDRAREALKELAKSRKKFELLTYPGIMGEEATKKTGIVPKVIGNLNSRETTSQDTKNAATEMREHGVELILFAGGDGTARDVFEAIDATVTVLGIPAGVKIHSGVFAATPKAAGRLAVLYLEDGLEERESEVMDIDEEAFRENRISARLFGYMRTPYFRELIQGSKQGSGPQDEIILQEIAGDVVEGMRADTLYIIGPGTTTKPIAEELGVEKTLLGVDVIKDGKLIVSDANEEKILAHLNGEAKIIVSVIGGQGFIFGRGNQQISPRVIKKVGKNNIIIVASPGKLASLKEKRLRVDTGDTKLDKALQGYYKIITGYARRTLYKVE